MNKTKLWTSLMLVFGGSFAGASGYAQDAVPSSQQLERVEVTGSAIKRIDAETAVPVTILRMDELKKEGVTTVEQVLSRLSANQSQQGTSQSVGLGTGGASFANLRGLGQNKTLVLLNGRRISNNAIDATAPDLNMIPFAAIERVEVLRDGASALYGTDAVGGVINFITRRDFTGGLISGEFDNPKHSGGGKAEDLNFAFGVGDYDKDGFNFFGVIDVDKQDRIRASERPELLARSVKTSSSTFPGQYNQGGNVQHPLYPGCGSPDGIPTSSLASGNDSCGYLYSRFVDLIPNTLRESVLLRGSLKVNEDTRATLEYFGSQNNNDTLIAGVPYSALAVNPGTKYYPGNGITPLPTSFTLNPTYYGLSPVPTLGSGNPPVTQTQIDNIVAGNAVTTASNQSKGLQPGFIKTKWRDQVSGGRAEATDNTQQRLVASLEGSAKGWDYQGGLSYNENIITDKLVGGYTNGAIITTGVRDGLINPFGPNDATGLATIASAAANGTLFTAAGKVYQADAKASRELGDWFHAGTAAAIAVGAEFRHETFQEVGNPPFDQLVISSTGFDPATNNRGLRNVAAAYTELNVPLFKGLDVTGSVRYDHYSDFGSTTNPKGSFRYQPIQQVLFRGSYSTGFRAPSLYDLNAPNTYTNTANNHDDPLNCPNGVGINGFSTADACGSQFIVLNGGNKTLKPEKSRNFNVGIVVEPVADANVGLDFWWIKLKQQIGTLSDDTIFGDPTKYAGLFNRGPGGGLSTDGSQCPGTTCGYVTDTTMNLGEVHTSGIDITGNYRLRAGAAGNFTAGVNSTYVTRYDYQNETGGIFVKNVGSYQGTGPVFRWQHTVNVTWALGQWGVGVVGHYKSGYEDENAGGEGNHVSSYTTFDIYGNWQPTKAIGLTVGMRNAFDRQPPYSNQAATFQVGYDPRFTDPTGRLFYARGTYTF